MCFCGQAMVNKYETYALGRNTSNGDMTGIHVTSDKGIAVFSGNMVQSVTHPVRFASRDHLVEQMPPVSTWGKSFVLTSIPTRITGEEYKIIASQANTTVIIRLGTSVKLNSVISTPGEHLLFHGARDAYYTLVADKPVLVVQFEQTKGTGETNGDPSMQIIPPVYLFTPDYTFTTPESGKSIESLLFEREILSSFSYNVETCVTFLTFSHHRPT